MSRPVRLGLVHTVPALAPAFTAIGAELGADAELVHVVDPSLLTRVIAGGVTDDVAADVRAHVRRLADLGVDAVLVTCSSVGECADAAAEGAGVPVLRVDRPMARRAVQLAAAPGRSGRITALATLASTLGPTRRLLDAEVARAGAGVAVTDDVVAGAADARAAGDQARHDALVRAAVVRAAADSDVVVLAQASMADALLAEPPDLSGAVVLSSPRTGLEAALAAAGEAAGAAAGERA
ncbi:aspartate/glutamate racemase family protein [Georgenia faecalis]|uniref:Aspartate/glutamate racemase family protein n=1 Tax=Georgenia faecalis TaxID=2483799 RepID=A0ABV9D4V1_9MICO|nr:aspartate/glutamate racemase family protein [Georgenia faecalis]